MFADDPIYAKKKEQLSKKVVNNILAQGGPRVASFKTKTEESELLHLFCDFMSCNYVDLKFKNAAIKEFLGPVSLFNESEQAAVLNYFSEANWFVNWDDLDFRNTLRKKRLKSTY